MTTHLTYDELSSMISVDYSNLVNAYESIRLGENPYYQILTFLNRLKLLNEYYIVKVQQLVDINPYDLLSLNLKTSLIIIDNFEKALENYIEISSNQYNPETYISGNIADYLATLMSLINLLPLNLKYINKINTLRNKIHYY